MGKINTLIQLCFSLIVVVGLPLHVSGQTVLTFPHIYETPQIRSSFLITNPSESSVEVEFTLYSLDGQVVLGIANPVRYQIKAQGQLAMLAKEVFAATGIKGWVEVTSSASGIVGSLFRGDFRSSLDSSSSSVPLTDQIIPWMPSFETELRIINPSAVPASINVTLTNSRGQTVGSIPTNLAAKSGIGFFTSNFMLQSGDHLTARVTSNVPVAVQALIESSESMMLVNGQSVSLGASTWIAPHVVLGGGFDSFLVLANPTSEPITVSVRLFNERGAAVHASLNSPLERLLSIPANGSISMGATQLSGLLTPPVVNGWIEVTSPNVPLGAVLIVEQEKNRTLYPLQNEGSKRFLYPQFVEQTESLTGLMLLNTSAVSAKAILTMADSNGSVVSSSEIEVVGNSKRILFLRDILSISDIVRGGALLVESSVPLNSVEIVVNESGGVLAAIQSSTISSTFVPAPRVMSPTLLQVFPLQGRPGDTIRIRASNVGGIGTVLMGNEPLVTRFLAPGLPVRVVKIPNIEAGFVDLTIRSADGRKSDSVNFLVLPNNISSLREISGRAFYEKIDVGANGLDLTRPVSVPIRFARVETVDLQSGTAVSVAETDERGHFRAAVPQGANFSLRVMSQLRSGEALVADNTKNGAVFSVEAKIETNKSPLFIVRDSDRTSGAFNILEIVRQGNAFVSGIEPTLKLPKMTIFWSPNNTNRDGDPSIGEIGGTFFDVSSSTAFVLGDRSVDSDEFDDSVVLHEYAHLLAAKFSIDDSPGGPHVLGDVLDPRMAWSEGWANFFSAVVRENSIYRDSLGFNGETILEHDLEVNSLSGDQPGYMSEFSVHSILWDLFDEVDDAGDDLQIPFARIWGAFRLLTLDSFVYLPDFLDRLAPTLDHQATTSLNHIVRLRSVDYSPTNAPSVSNPFPRRLSSVSEIEGVVDSLSRSRDNLAQSAHLYSFDTDGGQVSIRLDVTGLGKGQNPKTNDLDLFLMGSTGHLIGRSDRGLNGQSELISLNLPAGRYVVEIRSFYKVSETRRMVFNSGAYKLTVRLP